MSLIQTLLSLWIVWGISKLRDLFFLNKEKKAFHSKLFGR